MSGSACGEYRRILIRLLENPPDMVYMSRSNPSWYRAKANQINFSFVKKIRHSLVCQNPTAYECPQ